MSEFLHIAAFWVVVVVAIRIAVCFPQSLLARCLFSRHGPLPVRGESQADYLLRRARFGAGWFAQAAVLFVAGGVALQWDASLADSLYFLVLWTVVVPALGGMALVASLFVLGRSLCARWSRRASPATRSARAT